MFRSQFLDEILIDSKKELGHSSPT